jgi:predicted RND superfamily exporter protein
VPGVQSVVSLPSVAKLINAGWNEGSLKWRILPRNPQALAQAVAPIETASGLLNADGSAMPVLIFLADHRAETLRGVTDAVKAFAAAHPSAKAKFLLASGNAGVMAATNEVVSAAQTPIVLWVFGAVIALCLLTFRSLRPTVCIVVPLAIVSWLAYALMAGLGIGLKTSTLPVVALGRDAARVQGHRHRGRLHRAHARDRREHVAAFRPEIPGRHGAAAHVHVSGEHARGDPPAPDAGPLALPPR